MKMKKTVLVFVFFCLITVIGACGSTENPSGTTEEKTTNPASGTMLAGEEAPEITGTLKSLETNDEVMITVNGQEIVYRLSEEAKNQIDNKEVELGSDVKFTTFSIGDAKETVAEFIIE